MSYQKIEVPSHVGEKLGYPEVKVKNNIIYIRLQFHGSTATTVKTSLLQEEPLSLYLRVVENLGGPLISQAMLHIITFDTPITGVTLNAWYYNSLRSLAGGVRSLPLRYVVTIVKEFIKSSGIVIDTNRQQAHWWLRQVLEHWNDDKDEAILGLHIVSGGETILPTSEWLALFRTE